MSRRKQLKPRHVDADEEELAGGIPVAPTVVPSSPLVAPTAPSTKEADNTPCLNTDLAVIAELDQQRKTCPLEDMGLYNQDEVGPGGAERPATPPRLVEATAMTNPEVSEDELLVDRFQEEEEEEEEDEEMEEGDAMPSSPSANSDLNQEGSSMVEEPAEGLEHTPPDTANLDSMGMPDSNVKLESLQNTNVAVAQFAENNDVNTNDLAMLQSTLYHLQQQQLVQLQMLQQLQQHIVMGGNPAQIAAQLPPFLPPGFNPMLLQSMNKSLLAAMQNQKVEDDSGQGVLQDDESIDGSSGCTTPNPRATVDPEAKMDDAPVGPQEVHMAANVPLNPNNPILSSDLAKLELFKKGKTPCLPDDAEESSKDKLKYTADDPYFKYKCKFCYKVFGSDSSLQIHIRSHTGERPFKCNVCGNRFTTRGNLKVHFQRHKQENPNVWMNPNPVPEHMDNLQPALSAAGGENGLPPPASAPSHHQHHHPPPPPPPQSHHQHHHHHPLAMLGAMAPQLLPNMVPPMFQHESKEASRDVDVEDDGRASPPVSRESGKSPSNAGAFSPASIKSEKQSPMKAPVVPASLQSLHAYGAPPPLTSIPSSFAPQMMPLPGLLSSMAGSMVPFPFDGPPPPPSFMQSQILPPKMEDPLEEYMECSKSETSKLEALVKNIETKLTDPNQCAICQRILSCKSALQMHYRTHTGERPFRCKICGRAFTTKGNLKTHMGVHRAKPPLRMMHQCPVCHKQFTNSLVLQQHIRMHTGELPKQMPQMPPNDMMMQAAMMQPFPGFHFFPPGGPPGFPSHLPPGMAGGLDMRKAQEQKEGERNDELDEDDYRDDEMMEEDQDQGVESEGEEQGPEEKRPRMSDERSPTPREDVDRQSPYRALHSIPPNLIHIKPTPSSPEANERPSPSKPMEDKKKIESPVSKSAEFSALYGEPSVASSTSSYVPCTYSTSLMALEERVKAIDTMEKAPPHFSMARPLEQMESIVRRADHEEASSKKRASPGDRSPVPFESNSAYDSGPNSEYSGGEMTPSKPYGAIDLSVQGFEATTGRPFTTCDVCFKTFACKSALGIHYRSHSGERPYRCDVCDRTFTTRGNMRQHMLTHKIRDLPDQAFDQPEIKSTPSEPRENRDFDSRSRMVTPPSSTEKPLKPKSPVAASTPSTGHHSSSPFVRKPNLKHVCHVCTKPFSSASALQIHMRTHTGDKPFKCNVCGKAFTTKGNLKVHMGTHMWNNGPSRRGRRMSVEGLPGMPPKDHHDFYGAFSPHRSPADLFPFPFPGLHPGFSPKMNEISVIQSLNGGGTHLPPTSHAEAMMGHLSMMKVPMPHAELMHKTEAILKAEERKIKSETNNNNKGSSGELDLSVRKTSPGPKTSPTPATTTSPKLQPMPEAASNPTWLWKTTCHLCSKVFATSVALEFHMKSHMQQPSHRGEQASPKPLMA